MPGSDKRFEAIASDPRFNLPKKKAVKSQIDDRFKNALQGDDFKVKVKTDKYGRKLEKKGAKQELKRFYDFQDEGDSIGEKNKSDEGDESGDESDSSNSSDSSDSSSPHSSHKTKSPSLLDRMRGNVESSDEDSSSSSSSDSEDDEQDQDLIIENQVDEYDLGKSHVPSGDESHRLAVVNLDWDNIAATDLMVTFNSFIPKGSQIKSVSIYPSEYGKQRMSEEELQGPKLHDSKLQGQSDRPSGNSSEHASEHDKDRDYSSNSLRKYQLQRLQYYYAIVDCDSVAAAASIYNSCDGTEYEATANVFDIRYVPDEITFDDKPRDVCTSVPLNYAPQEFITSALQHSKAKLTWDETPKERKDFAARVFSRAEEDDMDLKAYLASDSESESERASVDKYRALLAKPQALSGDADGKGSDVDMEITFKSALDETRPTNTTGDDPLENLSTIDKYRLKEKERRQKRIEKAKARKAAEENEQQQADDSKKKAELELMLMDDTNHASEDEKSSQKPKKKHKQTKTREKREAMAEAEADFNTADPRFQALFEDPEYAIDSTNPQFKKTKAMDKVLEERRRRAPKEEKGKKSNKRKSSVAKKEESVKDLVTSLRNKKQRT